MRHTSLAASGGPNWLYCQHPMSRKCSAAPAAFISLMALSREKSLPSDVGLLGLLRLRLLASSPFVLEG